jgi:putative ABC transport system ATP-binding protein
MMAATAGTDIVCLRHLSKVYRTTEIETTVLRDVDITIGRGEFVAIMGPSGCGKTTLLNILGMLDRPSSGQYDFAGRGVTACSEAELAHVRKDNIGFVFQSFNLVNELNVFENVELALLYHKDVPRPTRHERVREVLERMQIAHRAKHRPEQLSGGQQQRVAIARAVVARPKLILADEPTGNLDSVTGEEVMQLLTELNAEGTTIAMVTHSRSHAEYSHRVINLLDGSIVTEDRRGSGRTQ